MSISLLVDLVAALAISLVCALLFALWMAKVALTFPGKSGSRTTQFGWTIVFVSNLFAISVALIFWEIQDVFVKARSGVTPEYFAWEVDDILSAQITLVSWIVFFLFAWVFFSYAGENVNKAITDLGIFLVLTVVFSYIVLNRSEDSLIEHAREFSLGEVRADCNGAQETIRRMGIALESNGSPVNVYESIKSGKSDLDYYESQISNQSKLLKGTRYAEDTLQIAERIAFIRETSEQAFISRLLYGVSYATDQQIVFSLLFEEDLHCSYFE